MCNASYPLRADRKTAAPRMPVMRLIAALVALALGPGLACPGRERPAPPSRAVGVPWDGRLVHGRRLPAWGDGYVTWDPIRKHTLNRPWRRWGTDRLVRVLERVAARRGPILIGDLSRPHGGDFGPRFGGIGHVSHQNGLDADVYYPREDGRLVRAARPGQVDLARAQALVDAFVRAGAVKVFTGPSLGLRGPPGIVEVLAHHDDHLHVRLSGG
jgi:hypothetical protein